MNSAAQEYDSKCEFSFFIFIYAFMKVEVQDLTSATPLSLLLDCSGPPFACPDSDDFFDRQNKYLAVTDIICTSGI